MRDLAGRKLLARRELPVFLALLLAAGGLCMMFPDTLTDLVGLMAMGGACALEYLSAKKGGA